MNDRFYFLLGDILSNMLVGAAAAAVCALLIDPDWNMLLAMLLGMPLGMLLALLLGLFLLYRYFGANEVMVPTMLSGMAAGMLTAMTAAMQPLSVSSAALCGALVGLAILGFCYYSDYLIRGEHLRKGSRE